MVRCVGLSVLRSESLRNTADERRSKVEMPNHTSGSGESPGRRDGLDLGRRNGLASNALVFDTVDIEPEHRFEAAKSFFDGVCRLKGLGQGAPYEVRNQSWRVEHYVANYARHGPTAISLSDEHVNRDYCTVIYFASGSYLNVTRGAVSRLGPGYLTTGAELDGLSNDGFEIYSLEAPRDAIGTGPLADGAFRAYAVDSAERYILLQLMQSVFEGLKGDRDAPGTAREDLASFFDLLSHGSATEEEAAKPAYIRARAAAMLRFIDTHLDDPELGPAKLVTAFGLSRAAVFRALEPFGGVASAIASRRMARAYRVLAEAEPQRGLVRAVAERCGYTDVGHFCRVFRRHLDVTPGDVAGLLQPLDDDATVSGARDLIVNTKLSQTYD
ncbi:MAG: AraC family transcriptional regulator [Pseudomonadota bacterium]